MHEATGIKTENVTYITGIFSKGHNKIINLLVSQGGIVSMGNAHLHYMQKGQKTGYMSPKNIMHA